MTVALALVGPGAIGRAHLSALSHIAEARVATLVGIDAAAMRPVADEFGVPNVTADLNAVLGDPSIDGVILCGPTQLHAAQALACLYAGKPVLVEIPLADRLADAEQVAARAAATGLTAMVAHTRRYNRSHRFVHDRIAGGAQLQQLVAATHFLRRDNRNALGEPRDWTDHLLWHHAAHTVDLFAWQAGPIVESHAVAGPRHPGLGIAMDMSVILRAENGAICTLSLSFNNDGPLGSTFRYICDTGTWIAHYDDLETGRGEGVDLSGRGAVGYTAQDRDFVESLLTGREPVASIDSVLPCYRVLAELEAQLG